MDGSMKVKFKGNWEFYCEKNKRFFPSPIKQARLQNLTADRAEDTFGYERRVLDFF